MAERRMFAKTIIDSDAFLDMPLSTQALYFHLCMRADDDGFINNPKKIQRMVGCGEDDMKLLLLKSFVIPFESGVCVIRHWRLHNYIRNDRYKPTVYQAEKDTLGLQENGVYSEVSALGIPDGNQAVYQMETQVRLGKDRLGKDSTPLNPPTGDRAESLDVETASGTAEAVDHSTTPGSFEEFWGVYPKKVGKGAARKAWEKLRPDQDLVRKIMSAVKRYQRTDQWQRDGGQYIPNPATWLNQERWEDEPEIAAKQRNTSYNIDELEEMSRFDLPDSFEEAP